MSTQHRAYVWILACLLQIALFPARAPRARAASVPADLTRPAALDDWRQRRLCVDGSTANEILDAAIPLLAEHDRGLFVLHWPDADAAGHRSGWMSNEYGDACRQMDGALERLIHLAGNDRTMFVLLADHGGGGAKYNDHESDHPADLTIPLVLWGAGVSPTWLNDASILDVPPTVLAALGVTPPDCFEGRILSEALDAGATAAAAVA